MRPPRRQTQPLVRRWPAGHPSGTTLLVSLAVGAYVAQLVTDYMLAGHGQGDLLRHWLALDRVGIAAGHYWQFLTYPLLHADPFHLLGNLLLLFFAGREVEPIVGTRHFLGMVGLGTLFGGIVHWFLMPAGSVLVGASPAATAIFIAFATILPELEVTVNAFFVLPLRIRAKYLAGAALTTCGVLWATRTVSQIGPASMLGAGMLSWLYVKQLGFGNPVALQRYIFNRRQRLARLARMSPEQFISVEIDPILDKISREGMHSLSRAERKILAQGREKIASKTAGK